MSTKAMLVLIIILAMIWGVLVTEGIHAIGQAIILLMAVSLLFLMYRCGRLDEYDKWFPQ